MFTFISSHLSLEAIQNNFLSKNYLSDTQWKYAKITLAVLSIFAALATLVSIYRCYQARELDKIDEVDEKPVVIPPHLSPKPPHSLHKPTEAKPDVPSSPRQQDITDDEKLAQQLQNQELDADAELAKKLQAQYDAEDKAKPMISPIKTSSPKPVVPAKDDLRLLVPPTMDPKPILDPLNSPVKTQPAKVDDSLIKDPKPAKPSPFTQIEKICDQISEKAFSDPTFSAVKALRSGLDPKTQQLALDLLNEMITEFERRHGVTKKLPYLAPYPTPTYFANDHSDRSEIDKKYLSLVGIRNLIGVGPEIIDDFRDTQFLGGQHHYAHDRGLNKFEFYTGNLVDLDIEFKAKDDHEAVKIVQEMIVKFGKMCGLTKPGLTATDVAKAFPLRKLEIPHFIPTAMSNKDRSNCALWKRERMGILYYYANVPDRDIVVLATLKIPYVLAEMAYRTKEHYEGKLPKEFFDAFFTKGLSTGCFNAKGHQLMQFEREWNDKLNGVLSIEEDARRKIEKGLFGPVIQKKGADLALKERFSHHSLTGVLEEGGRDWVRGDRPFDKWVKEESPRIRQIFIDKGIWESILYQFDAESDYFLLDEKTLQKFLKDFYVSLFD